MSILGRERSAPSSMANPLYGSASRRVERTVTSMQPPATPPGLARSTLREEILVVLALSLLASAVYAVLSLLSAPLKGVSVASVNQSNELARQVVGIAFSLAPVWLVVHLLRRSGEGVGAIGLAWDRPGRDVRVGMAFFVVVGLGGLGVYLAAVALGVNRFVVPVPPLGRWWTVPVLLLNAAAAGLLEEVIVLGYLVTRLRQLAWSPFAAVAASALLRGAYHLYQGWGGFAGNLAMGVLFGVAFLRLRRTWPFVIAHVLLDAAAGIGFIAFRHHLPGFS
jgi:membrane protease YdiL (CAAX protease family)